MYKYSYFFNIKIHYLMYEKSNKHKLLKFKSNIFNFEVS